MHKDRGILRQPTREFPFEDKRHTRPHIAKRAPAGLRVESRSEGGGGGASNVPVPVPVPVPASDVVKVHTYRRCGTPVKHDRDSVLVYDRARVKEGDVLVEKDGAPEVGSGSMDRSGGGNGNGDSVGEREVR